MSWDIHGCSGRCAKCGRGFTDGESFWCLLSMDETGPKREDYCRDCWNKPPDLKNSCSIWKGRYKIEPIRVEEEPIKEPISKHLLKKYIESKERLHQCLCYVLAILLERNKVFQERPSMQGNIVYEDRETQETYILTDPNLSIKELDTIELQLQEILSKELA